MTARGATLSLFNDELQQLRDILERSYNENLDEFLFRIRDITKCFKKNVQLLASLFPHSLLSHVTRSEMAQIRRYNTILIQLSELVELVHQGCPVVGELNKITNLIAEILRDKVDPGKHLRNRRVSYQNRN